jgi:hypothetical protein
VELHKNIELELAGLIADPQKVSPQHASMLNELLQQYPYYQVLHLLLAKANGQTVENHILAKASLYTNGQLLHQFLFNKSNSHQDFIIKHFPITDDQEVFDEISEHIPVFQLETTSVVLEDDEEVFDEITELDAPIFEIETVAAQPENGEEEVFEEITENRSVFEAENKAIPLEEEEEVFDEIAEVDINDYRPFRNSSSAPAEPTRAPSTEATEQPKETIERKHSLEDNFVFESIVSSDFFAFENKFGSEGLEIEDQPEQEEIKPPFIEEHDEAAAAEVENSQVSNYHDENLPYTFLWWLAKTRKEHQSFQPYAQPKKGNSQELQQQYVEHIFHLQTHLTENEALIDPAAQDKPLTKDFEIIDSFIRNDPQITPPNAEQIDNENKAKKSAEDQNDLVSETLASIYIEQMLYDKAIDTYEKLSLKFPEKSRYFADLIQSIQKKI